MEEAKTVVLHKPTWWEKFKAHVTCVFKGHQFGIGGEYRGPSAAPYYFRHCDRCQRIIKRTWR